MSPNGVDDGIDGKGMFHHFPKLILHTMFRDLMISQRSKILILEPKREMLLLDPLDVKRPKCPNGIKPPCSDGGV